MRLWSRSVNESRSPLPAEDPIKREISVLSNKRMVRLCERLVGYDRFVGEHASAAIDRTLPSAAPVCQLLIAPP
jgi:hypothetical protein